MWIGEETSKLDEWWRLKNVGYIYENLSRHMVRGRRCEALANLLSDVRWTLRRVEVGGWLALQMDMELLFATSDCDKFEDLRQVYEVLKRYWSEVSRDERSLTYYMLGSLSGEEQKKKYTALYINTMMRYLSRPFLAPRSKFLGPQDNRELSCLEYFGLRLGFQIGFSHWRDIAFMGNSSSMLLWSVIAQKKLRSISIFPTFTKLPFSYLAISANGKLIVSGHFDGTFIRLDVESGEPVGVSVKAHEGCMTCVAISDNASVIVTGSIDGTLRLWNGKSGKPKGKLMNQKNIVSCVVICESRSMIVSGSEDGTVCRWNMETSALIGEPMCGHKVPVTCVAVDENGTMVVSAFADTLLRWDAETGKQIGEPMCGHSMAVLW